MNSGIALALARSFRSAALLLAVGLLIGGCQQSSPGRTADVIIEDAHGSGSTLAGSPTEPVIASGGWSGRIKLWNRDNGNPIANWEAHTESVNGLLFIDDGRQILSVGYDGRIAVWTTRGNLVREWSGISPVTALAAASTAGPILTGHKDGRARLWTLSGDPVAEWANHRGAVRAVAMTADGLMASSGTDGQVLAWSSDTPPKKLESPPTDARTLAFQPGAEALIGGGWFDLFRWQLPDGSLKVLPTEHRGIVNTIRFLPDGRLASISRQTDSAVLLLNAETGTTLEKFKSHDLCGVAVQPTPDGRHLITSSDDASVRLWNLGSSPAPSP